MATDPPPRSLPSRFEAAVFFLKSRALQAKRGLENLLHPIARYPRSSRLAGAPPAVDLRTDLWSQVSSAEFRLKAGKVQNLRSACRILDGIEIPAGGVFSFWKQLGRTTRSAGYVTGRELRSGCLVPNLGGGLCALSGLLYEAALSTGCEIMERHGHSRILPGMTADPKRDATIFWNYVDLRFRVPVATRIEATLDPTHLIVRFRSLEKSPSAIDAPPGENRPAASGDCLSCGETTCFRHPNANCAPPSEARTAFLLDAFTPEANDWCLAKSRPGDQWLLPLDPRRFRKPNYAWTPPAGVEALFATVPTLLRSWKSRRLPAQGALRQSPLIDSERALARHFARRLDPLATHLVVSQNLLPHLQDLGVLGGRSYDVLLQRLSLADLHRVLDEAAAAHPSSRTLADFRADPVLVTSEKNALDHASRLVTPHRDLARRFPRQAELVPWRFPAPVTRRRGAGDRPRLFLPCSPLARKGIQELAAALDGLNVELLVLGTAAEGGIDPLARISYRKAALADLATVDAVILPAWVEHRPSIPLRALASGIPVIASRACGLPAHPLLQEIEAPDAALIRAKVQSLLSPIPGTPKSLAAV